MPVLRQQQNILYEWCAVGLPVLCRAKHEGQAFDKQPLFVTRVLE